MSILITGGAGFIGFHLARNLLDNNQKIIVIDNLNDYYNVELKLDRLKILKKYNNFSFYKGDINDENLLDKIKSDFSDISIIIHLAAQAGVRYSLVNPKSYIDSNISGYVKLLEFAKKLTCLKHLLFASSSSVYGMNNDLPFKIEAKIDKPISLYAATKSSGELISYTYSHLYCIWSMGKARYGYVFIYKSDI
jgi:UDP-glucuronate 4-epimerase